MTDMWDDDDRAVLAHLPFDEVTPPPELEERTMAAALARRPAGTDEVAAARQRRRSRVRMLIAAAAAIVAVVAIGALVATRNQSSGSPNRIEAVSANAGRRAGVARFRRVANRNVPGRHRSDRVGRRRTRRSLRPPTDRDGDRRDRDGRRHRRPRRRDSAQRHHCVPRAASRARARGAHDTACAVRRCVPH